MYLIEPDEEVLKQAYESYKDRLKRIAPQAEPEPFHLFIKDWCNTVASEIRQRLIEQRFDSEAQSACEPVPDTVGYCYDWHLKDAFAYETKTTFHLPGRSRPTLASYDRRRDSGQYKGRYGIWANSDFGD